MNRTLMPSGKTAVLLLTTVRSMDDLETFNSKREGLGSLSWPNAEIFTLTLQNNPVKMGLCDEDDNVGFGTLNCTFIHHVRETPFDETRIHKRDAVPTGPGSGMCNRAHDPK
jgi:hypothetical protein